jgi:hypothetical protein
MDQRIIDLERAVSIVDLAHFKTIHMGEVNKKVWRIHLYLQRQLADAANAALAEIDQVSAH